MKRKIALLLALVMVLSMVPMMSFAAAASYTATAPRNITKGVETKNLGFTVEPTSVTEGTYKADPVFKDKDGNVITPQTVSTVQVKVNENFILNNDQQELVVELPRNVKGRIKVTTPGTNGFANAEVKVNPVFNAGIWTIKSNTFKVTVDGNPSNGDGVLMVELTDLDIPANFNQDQVVLNFEAVPGSLFTSYKVPVVNVADGEVSADVREVNYITDSNTVNDIGAIRFTENQAGAAGTVTSGNVETYVEFVTTLSRAKEIVDNYTVTKVGTTVHSTNPSATSLVGETVTFEGSSKTSSTETFELKLPRGFYWDNSIKELKDDDVVQRYGFTAANSKVGVSYKDAVDNRNDRFRTAVVSAPTNMDSTKISSWEIKGLRIVVDPRLATKGDVVVTTDNLVEDELTIAVYGDYKATVKALTTPTRMAGQFQKLGEFEIREEIVGSLAKNRTITLTLPVGAKWVIPAEEDAVLSTNDAPTIDKKASELYGLEFGRSDNDQKWTVVDNERRTIRTTILDESSSTDRTGALLVFKDARVAIDPSFRGDLEVTVGGTAGAGGEMTLAKVEPAVTAKIETVNPVKIGYQNQKLADITITEVKAGAAARTDQNTGLITLRLPTYRGTLFANTPKAEVTEGDMTIEKVWMSADKQEVHIQITAKSDKTSSIKLTDLAVTMDRTAPEGELSLALTGDALVDAKTSAREYFYQADVLDTLVVANVVTSAEAVEKNKEVVLTIGNATMFVDGEAVTANAAPYIDEANRTMLPLKSIAVALGADVEWNHNARTVLVTKGSDRVLVTIGKDVMNVNGMEIPMRSKAVINEERTFLPLKDLGVALGASVEWDAATQTVTIN